MGLRISLLGVDEVRELGWVAQEEDGRVVVHKVQVAFLGVQLDGETTGVSGSIGGARLTSDGRETSNQLGLLADGVQERRATDVGDVVGDLEVAERAGTLGVDHSLGDSLSVEVGKRVDQVEVLQQQGAVLTNTLGGEWVGNGVTVGVCVRRRHG